MKGIHGVAVSDRGNPATDFRMISFILIAQEPKLQGNFGMAHISSVCMAELCFTATCHRYQGVMDQTEGSLLGLTIINAEDHGCIAVFAGAGFLVCMALVTPGRLGIFK